MGTPRIDFDNSLVSVTPFGARRPADGVVKSTASKERCSAVGIRKRSRLLIWLQLLLLVKVVVQTNASQVSMINLLFISNAWERRRLVGMLYQKWSR